MIWSPLGPASTCTWKWYPSASSRTWQWAPPAPPPAVWRWTPGMFFSISLIYIHIYIHIYIYIYVMFFPLSAPFRFSTNLNLALPPKPVHKPPMNLKQFFWTKILDNACMDQDRCIIRGAPPSLSCLLLYFCISVLFGSC